MAPMVNYSEHLRKNEYLHYTDIFRELKRRKTSKLMHSSDTKTSHGHSEEGTLQTTTSHEQG